MSKNKIWDMYMLHRGKAAIIISVLIARHIIVRSEWQFNYLYPLLIFSTLYMVADIVYATVKKVGTI